MTAKCVWSQDEEDGYWFSSCDEDESRLFEFTVGGPYENCFKFCPFCGKPIEEKT